MTYLSTVDLCDHEPDIPTSVTPMQDASEIPASCTPSTVQPSSHEPSPIIDQANNPGPALQWNIRGLRANYTSFQLLQEYDPVCACWAHSVYFNPLLPPWPILSFNPQTRLFYLKADWPTFERTTSQILRYDGHLDVLTNYDIFVDTLTTTARTHIPLSKPFASKP